MADESNEASWAQLLPMERVQHPMHGRSSAEGWYADPWDVDHLRWWDGHRWTGNVSSSPATAVRTKHRKRSAPKESIPNSVVTGGIGLLTLLALGAFIFGMGVQNAVQALTWTHTVAAAEIGQCGIDEWADDSGGATRCEVSVTFIDQGRRINATISDVDPGDVHGTGAIRQLNVFYDPHSPTDVQVDGVPDAWMIGCLIVGAGLIVSVVRVTVRYIRRRHHHRSLSR